jgi:hypothetical protein
MFRVTMVLDSKVGEWEVWAHLEVGDPRTMTESFVLGVGASKDEARLHALEALVDAGNQINAMGSK